MWNDLTEGDLVDFTASLQTLAPTSRRRKVSSLRALLKWLKRRGQGPAAELPSAAEIRLPQRLPKALTFEDLTRLLETADLSQPSGVRDRCLMELLYGTGLRVSEAVGLRMEEIDLERAAFRVTGKRGKTRVVPLPQHTAPWIERYLQEGRPKLLAKPVAQVFVGERGRPLSRQSAYHVLEQARRAAGIRTPVSPHTLRHTYAVHLVQGGADLRAVQELLGHASIATTQIYTQLDLATVRANYDQAHPRR